MDFNNIIENLKPGCRCKGVRKVTLIKSVEKGNDTVEKVWADTNTGNGSCKGKFCGKQIQNILIDKN